jgi:hypothetical protein
VAAIVAVKAQEAVGEDAAAEKGAELLLDESWSRTLAYPRPGEEGLELLAHDAVEQRVLRGVALVFRSARPRMRHGKDGLRSVCPAPVRAERCSGLVSAGRSPGQSRADTLDTDAMGGADRGRAAEDPMQ